jgi:lipid-A-disaccharide synthase-like uncharacterized protein
VKPGPVLAMVALCFVGMWLAIGPSLRAGARSNPNAAPFALVIGDKKFQAERLDASAPRPPNVTAPGVLYHFLSRSSNRDWLTRDQFDAALSRELSIAAQRPWLLRIANASQWASLIWVFIGLLGQTLFMGRMLIQWIVSEKERRSHITPAFWWFSLLGGVMLFVYFVWRQDPIAIFGQSTGVVIYARNLRLIYKQRRRDARARAAAAEAGISDDPAPEPSLQEDESIPQNARSDRKETDHARVPR